MRKVHCHCNPELIRRSLVGRSVVNGGCVTTPRTAGGLGMRSHKPSFNLWMANLHTGEGDRDILPFRPRSVFEHTRASPKWRLVTRMLGLGRYVRNATSPHPMLAQVNSLSTDRCAVGKGIRSRRVFVGLLDFCTRNRSLARHVRNTTSPHQDTERDGE
jgi:hypothetical protein